MIQPNIEQRLGRNTWLVLLSKKVTTAVVLLLLAVILGFLKDFIGQILFGGGATGHSVSSFISMIAVVILLIAVILFILGYIIARLQYNNYTFTIEEYDLRLKKGIFDIKEVSVPYRQIRGVDVVQTLMYRFFGVCRLVLTTTGAGDKKDGVDDDTVFDPIDTALAEEVRDTLQKRVGIQVIESEVKADDEATTDEAAAAE